MYKVVGCDISHCSLYHIGGKDFLDRSEQRLLIWDCENNTPVVYKEQYLGDDLATYKGEQLVGYPTKLDLAKALYTCEGAFIDVDNFLYAAMRSNPNGIYHIPNSINFLTRPLTPASDGTLVVTGGGGLLSYYKREDANKNLNSLSSYGSIFSGASYVDISGLDMLGHCPELMFFGCMLLEKIKFPKEKVFLQDSYAGMFGGCAVLSSVDLTWASMLCCGSCEYMFNNCLHLTSVSMGNTQLSDTLVGDGEVSVRGMFYACPQLGYVEFNGFRVENVFSVNVDDMFHADNLLKRIVTDSVIVPDGVSMSGIPGCDNFVLMKAGTFDV